MDPGTYKSIHYIGIFFLLTGFGGLIFSEKEKIKLATISHGVGLLLTPLLLSYLFRDFLGYLFRDFS